MDRSTTKQMWDRSGDLPERARVRAETEAARKKAAVRRRLGRTVVEAVEEYFPEYRRHRRMELIRAFVAGAAVGFLARGLLELRR